MSRIGKMPISIPSGVKIDITKGNFITVKGPKGELAQQFDADLTFEVGDTGIDVKRPTDSKRHRSVHGLSRALLYNMVHGVTSGFVKELEVVGVGYRVSNTGQLLELILGMSHPIHFYLPAEISVDTKMEKGKNPYIRLESIDNQLLGQVCAKIRSFRKPEPYKGKGIRFAGEVIRRKAGKTAGK